MSYPDWDSVPSNYNWYSVDAYGMQAAHTKRPIFNAIAGKWMPQRGAQRFDLGLRQIYPDHNASATLKSRPGYDAESDQPVEAPVRPAAPATPQGVNSETPPELLFNAPRTDAVVAIEVKAGDVPPTEGNIINIPKAPQGVVVEGTVMLMVELGDALTAVMRELGMRDRATELDAKVTALKRAAGIE